MTAVVVIKPNNKVSGADHQWGGGCGCPSHVRIASGFLQIQIRGQGGGGFLGRFFFCFDFWVTHGDGLAVACILCVGCTGTLLYCRVHSMTSSVESNTQ